MKKLILLLMCICFAGCTGDNSGSVSVETTTAAETTTVPETTTVAETTAAETTTVPETTTVAETTTAETTTVAETTTAETTTIVETTTVETTTVSEITTVAATIETEETTVTEAVAEDYSVIELEGKKYKLSFEDNFDGDKLDETKWERCPEWKRQDLNCYWDDDMSYLDGEGNLVLETRFENTNKYLCGAVHSKGKFEQAYGYFEIKCTVNTVPGYWTAFWLMGDSVADETNGGVNGTEIDIMESAFLEEKLIQNTLNWDGYGEAHKWSGFKAPADVYDGEYHTFSLLWKEDEYVFFIDGEESWRTDAAEALGVCEVPLYMKITAETGSWTKLPYTVITGLPDYMKVDYVRVYSAE